MLSKTTCLGINRGPMYVLYGLRGFFSVPPRIPVTWVPPATTVQHCEVLEQVYIVILQGLFDKDIYSDWESQEK